MKQSFSVFSSMVGNAAEFDFKFPVLSQKQFFVVGLQSQVVNATNAELDHICFLQKSPAFSQPLGGTSIYDIVPVTGVITGNGFFITSSKNAQFNGRVTVNPGTYYTIQIGSTVGATFCNVIITVDIPEEVSPK